MNKKLLCTALLLGGMGVAHVASAQEFDDRWYVSGSTGVNFQDKDRGTEDAPFGTLGFGKFLNQNFSLDAEVNYQNPAKNINPNLWFSQYGVSLDARYHFRNADSKWWPYLRGGLGWQRHEEEYELVNNPNSPGQHEDSNLAVNLGAGLQFDFGRVNLRTELGTRIDFDDVQAGIRSNQDQFVDVLASVGLTVALGPEPMAPVAPAPYAPPPPMVDDTPVPVTIDLRGVNFDFDKSTLRPDAVAILNEAMEILRRYPEVRVEVAGHTDLCGSDAYNQSLSERRARAVYNYMTSNGIDAGRLAGPLGYGESRPLEPTAQTLPECKNERNRRTELNVQN